MAHIAGLLAGSVALVSFGLDSVIEVTASAAGSGGFAPILTLHAGLAVERISHSIIGCSFIALPVYVLVDASARSPRIDPASPPTERGEAGSTSDSRPY